MNKTRFGIIFLLMAFMAAPALAAPYKILYLNSYHSAYDWSQDIERGIKEGFAAAGTQVTVKAFEMDTKRKSTESQKEEAGELARKEIESYKPDLVIASDDDAQQYVVRHYAGQKLPFVFCGVNEEPAKYGFPASNITGLLERTYATETLKISKAFLPSLNRVVVISDDSPVTSAEMKRIQENEKVVKAVSKVGEIVAYHRVPTFAEWQQIIEEYQGKTDAFLIMTYHTIKDESGNPVPAADVMKWTVEHNRVPELGLWEFAMKDGALMGVTISGFQHGYDAARMASDILKGKKPGDIPVEVPKTGKLIVNTKRASMLGIKLPDSFLETVKKYDTL